MVMQAAGCRMWGWRLGGLAWMAVAVSVLAGGAAQTPMPMAAPLPPAPPAPVDRPFRGTLTLEVRATDTDHQIMTVHETLPVQAAGDTVLFYPEWEPPNHAPTATVEELAGLTVVVDGRPTEWVRDPVDMHAFHVQVPQGSRTISLDFEFLAPIYASLLRSDMVIVPWQRVLLYPAGWYARNIPVAATLTLPQGLTAYGALSFHPVNGDTLRFDPVSLEQLVDAPLYAGRHTRRIAIGPDKNHPVSLDLLADHQDDLVVTEAQVGQLRTLVAQTLKTFGGAPYRHYDVLVSLSERISPGNGFEHLEEGEINLPPIYFTEPGSQLSNLDLISHEFVHAWNGLWRTPADLWSPTFNRPLLGSLLWVYEGQTEFWGLVLAARAGLRDRQRTLDQLALDADLVAHRTGRRWKDLQDSTHDVVYMTGHRIAWQDWQRRADYYPEGALLWLDVEARLRQRSQGQRGMDDFAQAFFSPGAQPTRTYTFQDVCATLNRISPDDWAGFLGRHLHSHRTEDALAGLAQVGWRLVYSPTPTEAFKQREAEEGALNLEDSIGLEVDERGWIVSVLREGPAFQAGLSPGMRVTKVGSLSFSLMALREAVQASKTQPLILLAIEDRGRVAGIRYGGGLQYPHLERIPGTADRLTELLKAR